MFRQRPHGAPKRRLVSALVLAAAVGACRELPDGPRCPEGTARDEGRLVRLQQRLASDPLARSLVVATQGRYVTCFGDGIEPGIDAEHRLRLDRRQDDARAAAKLGHLLLHVSRGLPFDEGDTRPCAERLARAHELERAAHALESSLLQRFGFPALDDVALHRVMAGYRTRCAD